MLFKKLGGAQPAEITFFLARKLLVKVAVHSNTEQLITSKWCKTRDFIAKEHIEE